MAIVHTERHRDRARLPHVLEQLAVNRGLEGVLCVCQIRRLDAFGHVGDALGRSAPRAQQIDRHAAVTRLIEVDTAGDRAVGRVDDGVHCQEQSIGTWVVMVGEVVFVVPVLRVCLQLPVVRQLGFDAGRELDHAVGLLELVHGDVRRGAQSREAERGDIVLLHDLLDTRRQVGVVGVDRCLVSAGREHHRRKTPAQDSVVARHGFSPYVDGVRETDREV